MKLSHLALTVIEDPDHEGRYRWLLLRATGDTDAVEEFSMSEDTYPAAVEAFQAGTARWLAAMNDEDEDPDPVGDASVE